MNLLRICLFGKFQMRCGERITNNLEARKVQELFSYLLLYRDRPHPRESLAHLLWGETSTAKSKNYLRKALWQLQTAVDNLAGASSKSILMVEHDWIQFNPEASLWLDVAQFEQAYIPVQGVPGKELDHLAAQTLQKAVELYQADLLEGCYLDWCLYERERYQYIYLAMLDKLISYCEIHHHFEAAVNYATLGLRHDRARERTHRRMMRSQYLAGNRTGALRQYERCVRALDKELDVKPSKRTVELYKQILSDTLDIPDLGAEEETNLVETPLLSDILDSLQQLQIHLNDIQGQVNHRINTVKLAMRIDRH